MKLLNKAQIALNMTLTLNANSHLLRLADFIMRFFQMHFKLTPFCQLKGLV